jgi:pimeloyl-ACP methyl ester carboxylesterase
MRKIATAIILALLVGQFVSAGQAPGGSAPSPVGDALVDIGGRSLYVSCTGAGNPTVILEAGLGRVASSTIWKAVQPAVAEITRVCAYDRAGRGTSDPDPRTATEFRTGRAAVEDLRLLLRAASITGPYVLVGHSLGGAYTRLYAGQFPQDVVGMVLVDASHEEQNVSFKSAGYSEPPEPTGQNPERTDLSAVLEELRQAHWRADIPLVVLSHGRKLPLPNASDEVLTRVEAAWLELQRELASRSSRGRLVIAQRSGHNVQNDEPELVVEAIREVVTAARGTVAR